LILAAGLGAWPSGCGHSKGAAPDGADGPGPADAAVDLAPDLPVVDAPASTDAVCFIDNPPSQPIPICCGKPGQTPYNSCWPRDVVERAMADCVTEGHGLDGLERSIGRHCCASLSEREYLAPSDAGQCEYPGPPGLRVCTRCGDGTCGGGENRCNCSADCLAGADAAAGQ
jgi:hypothetical protein